MAMRRPRNVLPVPLLALALLAGGCAPFAGDDEAGEPGRTSASPKEASPADGECRDQWAMLREEVGDQAEGDYPSTLQSRWASVTGGLDYYATSATASDCGKTLDAKKSELEELTRFVDKVRPWDVQWQHDRLEDDATSYSPPRGRRGKDAPSRREVRSALATMEKQAEKATADQDPAWQQASAVDLGDRKAQRKARKDLKFLSEESAAWRKADRAQQTVQRALRARRG